MIRYKSEKQPMLEGVERVFETRMVGENRWEKLSEVMPWDELADAYYRSLTAGMGRPAKDARLVIGALIIKHKLCLSDEETIEQIRENAYLQYFVGFSEFQKEAAFSPTLFVEIRRRMGQEVFEEFNRTIIKRIEKDKKREGDDDKDDKDDKPNQGKMIADATVAEQAIKYPTDLDLLNESRETTEEIIDELHKEIGGEKPRTYRQGARKKYLSVVKRRKAAWKIKRRGIKEQLQYVRRNLKHINSLLDNCETPLTKSLLRKYWIIQEIYRQQEEMYRTKTKRCDDRIVSLSQPQVRPIIRGKANKTVEFGAKIGVSLVNGIASVDRLNWGAYNESEDLIPQVKAYKKRYGYYPETVAADPIYGTRENRKWLKDNGIRFAGKPLGRPPKDGESLKQRQADYRLRIPIEGKFGQGKNRYGLSKIKAKTARTSEAWIRSIFLVMNLIVLQKVHSLLQNLTKYFAFNQRFQRFLTANNQNRAGLAVCWDGNY